PISLSNACRTGSLPSASISAASARSCGLVAFEGSHALFKIGKAAREVCHDIAAIARWAGSGRGAKNRFGRRELPEHDLVTLPTASDRRGGGGPLLHRFRHYKIGQQRSHVLLPQGQVAASQILGGCH